MTTAAPLPRLVDLIRAPWAAEADDEALARPWKRQGQTAFWFSRAAWAIAALARVGVRGGRPAALWLPDYFCNQSTAPARITGAEIVFYPVGADLNPKWEECRRLAEGRWPTLFFLVHYFGAAADAAEARRFCDDHGALLIEDAAHVLAPRPGIGEQGDAVFYSPRKLLAIPDGALLLARDPDLAQQIGRAASALPEKAPSALPWLAKRLVQKAFPEALQRRWNRVRTLPFAADPSFARLAATPQLSALGRRLLALEGPRLEATADRYRRGREELGRLFKERTDAEIFAPAMAAATPYRLVLRFADEATAAARYATWRDAGLPVETWPDLAPEVLAAPAAHAVALGLRRTLLFVPLHQGADLRLASDRFG